MVDFVWRDGARLTAWMNYQINRLDAECRRLFGVGIFVSSGIRLNSEQRAIFFARYVTAGNVRGRKVYDTRWFEGRLWYRISSAGTVAPPGQSNHELQGDNGAADLRDGGSDAGITNRNSARGRWIRSAAVQAEYGIEPEGDGFGEGWHFKMRGVLRTPPNNPAGGGGNVVIPPVKPNPSQEVLEMSDRFIATRSTSKVVVTDADRKGAWVNSDSGFVAETSYFAEADAIAWAAPLDKPTVIWLAPAQYAVWIAGLAQVRGNR